ncbi:MAG: FixH family protein [Burkholderiaceae bacterium]
MPFPDMPAIPRPRHRFSALLTPLLTPMMPLLAATMITAAAGYSGAAIVGQSIAAEPAATSLQWRATSAGGKYQFTIGPAGMEAPVGRHHEWLIVVTTPDGAPVRKARLSVGGGMRGHGHGMPSQPVVTGEEKPGHYRVEGMLFNMHGKWNILIRIDAESGTDTADIAVDISF